MNYLGYIFSKGKVKLNCSFIKVVKDFSLVELDKPCLICGLSEAKEIASDKFSILNKKISDNLYWTFGRTEKRDEHEKDIASFCNSVFNEYVGTIRYMYLNVMNISYSIAKRLLNFVFSSKKKYIYIWNEMVYISCNNKTVVGISIKICRYCGIDIMKLMESVSSNEYNVIIDDDRQIPYNILKVVKDKRFVVPFILQLKD